MKPTHAIVPHVRPGPSVVPGPGPIAPNAEQAEQALIGAVLIDPGRFPVVAPIVSTDDFFFLRHRLIWDAFGRLNARGDAIDVLTTMAELSAMRQPSGRSALDDIGGDVTLFRLVTSVATSLHAETYARLVQRAALRRSALDAAETIRRLAVRKDAPIDHLVREMVESLTPLTQRAPGSPSRSMREAVGAYYDTLEARILGTATVPLVPTGFPALDAFTAGGLPRGNLSIVAAPPGRGKTPFLTNVALNVARLGGRVVFVSLELSTQELLNRFVSLETGIPGATLHRGALTDREWGLFVEAAGRLGTLPIQIIDAEPLRGHPVTPALLRTLVQHAAALHGVDLLIVDYLQLLTIDDPRIDPHSPRDIALVATQIKQVGVDLAVPVLAAAQYDKATVKAIDAAKLRPSAAHLAGGQGFQNTCALVLHLHQDAVFPDCKEIIVDKNRFGGRTHTEEGEIRLRWQPTIGRFSAWPPRG